MRHAAAALAGVAVLAACTPTSGYPPQSCAAAARQARTHINDFAALTKSGTPAVLAIDNVRETGVETGGGRYKLERFCRGDGRLADGTTAPVLWVIKEKQDGWLAGFGFSACVVGHDPYCVE